MSEPVRFFPVSRSCVRLLPTSGRFPGCRGATGGRYDHRLPSCSAHSRPTRRSPVTTANRLQDARDRRCARLPLRNDQPPAARLRV